MLVDNFQSYNHNDFNDFLNTDLFANDLLTASINAPSLNSTSPPTASSSRASSPQSPYHSNLLTPPQSLPAPQFPEFSPSSFFNLLDDEPSKQLDPMMSMSMSSSAPFDFMSAFTGVNDIGIDSSTGMDVNMDLANLGTDTISLPTDTFGIDPQLVGTPSTLSEIPEEEEEEEEDVHGDNDAESSEETSNVPTTKSSSRSGKKSPSSSKEQEQEQEKLTLVIQPIKAGGHGKARKGTVLSGGITKKASSPIPLSSAVTLVKDQDASNRSAPGFTLPTYAPPSAFTPTNVYPPKSSLSGKANENKDKDDEDDDLPQDWRPSPEVFAKMTSKEKRQLRNKISARNFRVRRKEYISTLEGDIAERDRLLDAIRTELGSTQSENFALRQEIAALKRTLLDGRGISATDESSPLLHLPPPAPLPVQSAAAALAAAQQQQQPAGAGNAVTSSPASPAINATANTLPTNATATQLLTANTQKDASASGSRFWAGAKSHHSSGYIGGMGVGGITPVHRVMLPEVSVSVTDLLLRTRSGGEKLQENMNPLLNDATNVVDSDGEKEKRVAVMDVKGFDSFTEMNPFTMKTLDAYRMHLWGKMAAQHQSYQQQQQQQLQLQQQQQLQQLQSQHHLTGLASSLRPAFFSSPFSYSLSGKHSLLPPYTTSTSTSASTPSSPPPPYQSAPPSPLLGAGKSGVLEKLERERERERERQREKEEKAIYAATIASQTLLRKLGSAFWDAFSGSASPGSSTVASSVNGSVGGNAFVGGTTASSASTARAWDADKVRKVLEGKAVVRVVDIEDLAPSSHGIGHATQSFASASSCSSSSSKKTPATATAGGEYAKKCHCAVTDILEESMRSLSIGKKA